MHASCEWLAGCGARIARAAAASALLAAAVASGGCVPGGEAQQGVGFLPHSLDGVAITDSITGQRAMEEIARLHGKEVAPEESRIGIYGTSPIPTVLYMTRFASARKALTQVGAMSAHIDKEQGGFSGHGVFDVDGCEVHSAWGHGQLHYFFADGRDVVWLAADSLTAHPMLAELLGTSTVRVMESVRGSDWPASSGRAPKRPGRMKP